MAIRRRELITLFGGAAATWPLIGRANQTARPVSFLSNGSPSNAHSVFEDIISRNIAPMAPANGKGGVAVALRINGQTLLFKYGWADRANDRRITADSLFN